MIYDFNYFHRRYQQIENDLLEILDFINISNHFGDPCYQIGSSKLMDFCIKIGTEIETLFRQILEDKKFDSLPDISNKRKDQNISVYRDVIEPLYRLKDYSLFVKPIRVKIFPFLNFDRNTPEWFKIYSKYKHNKLKLLEKWNLIHSLNSLGALLLLVLNHPDIDGKIYNVGKLKTELFDLNDSYPRFCKTVIETGL